MENYNEIPKTGTIGGMVDNINANFQLTKEMLERIQLSKDNSRGLFTTAAALQTAYPSPEVGDWAIVGSTSPFDIYICSTAGTWADSGNDYNGGEVNLSEYAKKTSVDSLASTVSNEASRLRTDEAWLQRVDNDNMANGRQITTLGSQLTDMKTVDDRQDSDIEGIKEDLRNLNPVVIDGNVTNNPDNVFLTSANDEITPKERTTSLSAKGHYIMRPTDNFAAKLKANYIHEIPFDVDLGGTSVTIPANAVLKFTGGKITNGTLVLQNTLLDGDVKLAADVAVSGTCANLTAKQSWFAYNDVDAWHRFMSNVGGCKVYDYETGEYTANDMMQMTVNEAVTIHGNGAILRHTYQSGEAYVNPFFHIAADMTEQEFPIVEAIQRGQTVINVGSDVSSFAVGDAIVIRDKAPYSYCPERQDYRKGEFATVAEIDATNQTITINHATYDSYDHIEQYYDANGNVVQGNACSITIIKMANVEISNLHVVMEKGSAWSGNYASGIALERVSGNVTECTSEGFTTGISIKSCYRLDVVGGMYNATQYGTSATAYGVAIVNSQSITMRGIKAFVRGNHAISVGGNSVLITVNRIINFIDCVAQHKSNDSNAIDCHANAEYITIRNCHANKMEIYGQFITVENCVAVNSIDLRPWRNLGCNVINNTAKAISVVGVGSGNYFLNNYDRDQGNINNIVNIIGNTCTDGQISISANGGGYENTDNDASDLTYNISENKCKSIVAQARWARKENGQFRTFAEMDFQKMGVVNISKNTIYDIVQGTLVYGRVVNISGNTITIPADKSAFTDAVFYVYSLYSLISGNTIINKSETNNYTIFSARCLPLVCRVEDNTFDRVSLFISSVTDKASQKGYFYFLRNKMTAMLWPNNLATIRGTADVTVEVDGNYYPDKLINGTSNSRAKGITVTTAGTLIEGRNWRGSSQFPCDVSNITTHIYSYGDGIPYDVKRSGTTAQRPTGGTIIVGYRYFDTTLGKPVYAKTINGDTVTWVDATGTTV